ncbi:CubicO group peptidase, beta-lactamase class C family [Filimonas lacunae]|uniref:CubicO group peptidase, beta-lactamase class C family n=1 Tax=Filimonas lacunae TaxID=477680 RepID=A0A173MHD9_9BACT|nr:serine hydrolase [Filimonas lacunae]BAV07015.1 beta-lactamase class C and other penicillin binding proteins [Filimonas lacunae]SIS96306.1 CubicO group peptidase, beta-lactamase class C family [Filimonas lacunae]
MFKHCHILLHCILAASFTTLYAQPAYKPSYQQLKKYEGTYEYINHTTLQIAASPKDTLLYAIIGEARYPLFPHQKDVFLNGSKQKVTFQYTNNTLTGYTVANGQRDSLYRLLTRKVSFSNKMWFAKGNGTQPFTYQYQIPPNRHDGLIPGSLYRSGLDTSNIHLLMNRIVNNTYPDIHSVLLVKDGKLILEEYFYEYDESTLHQLRSATKSFASAIIGLAIDKKLIADVHQKVLPYFPEYQLQHVDNVKKDISIYHLLTQQSGLACDDRNDNSPGNETKMYPANDWVQYILDLPMIDTPGKAGRYCSGNTMITDRIAEKVSGQSLARFAQENLFTPLGITHFQWPFVPDKTHQESFGQLYLRPRDMAKFGLLYLNNGIWNGRQVISSEWVQQSLTRHSVVDGMDYGYFWWLEPLTVKGRTYQGMAAKGNGGQRIFIWPEIHMVAVVTAGSYNQQSAANRLLMECVLSAL